MMIIQSQQTMHWINASFLFLILALAAAAAAEAINYSDYHDGKPYFEHSVDKRHVNSNRRVFCGETFYTKQLHPVYRIMKQRHHHVNRIIKGIEAKPGLYPFLADLWTVEHPQARWSLCGGVIIDNNHILTAGHCRTDCYRVEAAKDRGQFHTWVGVGCRKQNNCKNIEKRVLKSVTHENFKCNFVNPKDDLALLKMPKPMEFKLTKEDEGSVNRVCMPFKETKFLKDEPVYAIGWGRNVTNKKVGTETPQVAEMFLVDDEECRSTYAKLNVTLDMRKVICAISRTKDQSPCIGDSGGPLLGLGRFDRYVLVGITTAIVENNCNNKLPTLFTRVSYYLDWIEEAKRKLT